MGGWWAYAGCLLSLEQQPLFSCKRSIRKMSFWSEGNNWEKIKGQMISQVIGGKDIQRLSMGGYKFWSDVLLPQHTHTRHTYHDRIEFLWALTITIA